MLVNLAARDLASVARLRVRADPLWAGIYLMPLTIGFLIAGPASGYLSDRIGARMLSTGGLLLVAAAFFGLLALPVNFPYPLFASVSSDPVGQRGVA
jgi:MFS family permease